MWRSGYHNCTASFNKAWTQVLCRFKSCSRRVGDSRWWRRSMAIIPTGNKAKRLSKVNHTTKAIHHHHHDHRRLHHHRHHHFFLKCCFCNFSWKVITLIRFHLLILTVNQENVFSRCDAVTSPYTLLCVVTLLSILTENIVLQVLIKNYRSQTFPLPGFELKTKNNVFNFQWRNID